MIITTEQKAKAYDKALKQIKECTPDENGFVTICSDEIFPELAESEDDKIRKDLMEWFEEFPDKIWRGHYKKDIIAWLEKQDKQEQLYIRFGEIPTDEKSKIYRGEIEVGTENGVSVYPAFKTDEGDIVLGLNLPITKTTLYTQQHLIEYDNRPCYLVKGDYVGKDTDGQPLINNISIIEKIDNYRVKDEKQVKLKPIIEMITPEESLGISSEEYNEIVNECLYGKPKPADKVKPKFKNGQWIVWKDKCYKVNYNGCGYELVDQNGLSTSLEYGTIDENAHIWDILKDANDGDLLVCDINKAEIGGDIEKLPNITQTICIYQNVIKDKDYIHSYCSLYDESSLVLQNTMYYNTFVYNIHPATNKQRDLLFQKMKEAGYEWDAEKKELKKIVDEEQIKKNLQNHDFRRMFEQKPDWGEEDEKMVNDIIAAIDTLYYHGMVKWLKSLKQRIIG